MTTEMGEYLVGAYLKLILKCDVVDYNVRAPGGKLEGLGELDVVGFRFIEPKEIYLCEVTTHIRGLLYGGNQTTITRVKKKYLRQCAHATKHFPGFKPHFMFWSPNVPKGFLTRELEQLSGLDLVINGKYKEAICKLTKKAKDATYDAVNPAFRLLQILEHMRD